MSTQDINRLVGEFMDLYQEWNEAPSRFDWERMKSLAAEGAQAYNEGRGPSFHILAFDGYPLDELHERFLDYLLDAGFDPFETVPTADSANYIAVFNHDGLADAARSHPAASRMMLRLRSMARHRLLHADAAERQRIVLLCQESIPADVVEEMAPALG
ncbi:hypothetical protein E4K72_21190 [Oxalobacteraceae bacterium OM1]|nr:hypothetical protein E4K72_21190 [Oxalobacteraceae bacterium OM1]